MNSRIKELYDQCREFDNEDMKYIFYHEKFAELIVRECAGIAHGSDMPDKDIREHFGIKE